MPYRAPWSPEWMIHKIGELERTNTELMTFVEQVTHHKPKEAATPCVKLADRARALLEKVGEK